MTIADVTFLVFITLAMCVIYFILLALFPLFFSQKITTSRKKSFIPLVYIVIFSLLVYVVSFSIQNLDLSDRILHIFGGGFLGFFICFLAAKNSGVRITTFQFFLFSVLTVTTLGVANELLEFFLQTYFGYISAATVTDTWLDLASNTVGIILASICFVPFYKNKNIDK